MDACTKEFEQRRAAYDLLPGKAMLVNDPLTKAALQDVQEGRVLTFKEICAKCRISKEFCRTTFAKDPNVFKLGTEYRVPQSVFDRFLVESLRKNTESAAARNLRLIRKRAAPPPVSSSTRHTPNPRPRTLNVLRVRNAFL